MLEGELKSMVHYMLQYLIKDPPRKGQPPNFWTSFLSSSQLRRRGQNGQSQSVVLLFGVSWRIRVHTILPLRLCQPLEMINLPCLTLPDRRTNFSYPIFINEEIISEGNFVLLDLIVDTLGMGPPPPPCRESYLYISCLVTAPPCSIDSDLPLKVCPESCQAFNMLMASSTCTSFNENVFSQLDNGFATASFRNVYTILVNSQFNCSDTSPYVFSQNGFDEDECTNIFSSDVQGLYSL